MAKIMVVEDEAVIRQLIIEELEKWQFETFGTTDFHQVFDDFEEQEPQLILLDINLPVLTAIIGARKSERHRKYRLFLYQAVIRIWI